MEEKQVPESLASVTIKPDYPPSEYCASEPPPAYHKHKSSAVQVAKIIAVTVVVVSFVLGIFILASAYVTATASCRQLEQDLELLGEVADRFDNSNLPQPEALRQEETKPIKRQSEPVETPKKNAKDIDDNSVDDDESASDSDEESKTRFRLPLQIDFDDLAGSLIAKNQRSKMNCIVEKKRAEQVVDHQPKTVRLPFGVNLTTDPRFERLTGERMVIICESGNVQSAQPQQPEKPQQEDEDDEDDNEQDTIMIQPVMIPIPHTAFQTHMPQQMAPAQQEPQIEIRPYHPMETMRPPMPPMRPAMEQMRPQMEQMRPSMEQYRLPMDQYRPPMRPMMEQPRVPVERIIAIRQSYEPVSQSLEPQRSEEVEQQRPQMMFVPQQMQIRVEPQQSQQQSDVTPNPIIQHIIQQIIAQKIMESQKQREESQAQESREPMDQPRPLPLRPVPNGLPIPEEVLTQLNRLPNSDRVIVAVSEPDSSDEDSGEDSGESQEMNMEHKSTEQAVPDMANRQAYIRRLPVNIPVNMMQQQVPEPEEPHAVASEETRPHFSLDVQPRSVSAEEPKSRVARSVNPLLPEKRVKRCACDCAC
ncbi:bromodomain-containing protein DDB_G0280777 isoform X1 [Euwallacea fornicatus]|uniref:bromodomain-containing protein DDB_G0280777 isoform X1 n=1 Tax=Euwallacea fornicatus TaxID=995702 RepID=UPI00338D7360